MIGIGLFGKNKNSVNFYPKYEDIEKMAICYMDVGVGNFLTGCMVFQMSTKKYCHPWKCPKWREIKTDR